MSEVSTEQSKSGNRRVLLGIFGIPVVVFAFSTALYYLVQYEVIQLGTVNNGELVTPPLELNRQQLSRLGGEPYAFEPGEAGQWSFLVIGDQRCVDSCERMLYVARQSIVAMGKKMHRMRLAYLTSAESLDPEFQARIDQEYRSLELLHLPESELAATFSGAKLQAHQPRTFFVVDPEGWLMMYYQVEDTEQDTLNTLGKAVVRDMKRLIK